jgi:hypothetical protein
LGNQGYWVVRRVVEQFLGRRRVIDQDAAVRWGIGVGEQSDIVDERRLPGTGGSNDTDDIAHSQVDTTNRLQRPGFVTTTEYRNFSDPHRARLDFRITAESDG